MRNAQFAIRNFTAARGMNVNLIKIYKSTLTGERMYLIAGLGNPGAKYEKTRHNMGFDCIDVLARKLDIKLNRTMCRAQTGRGMIGNEKVILAKPQTYMNLSGNAVAALLNFYKIDPAANLIVIYDDTDLDAGRLRIRKKGSAGGHNGMKSIVEALGGRQDFIRVRIGIGKRPDYMDMTDFVLGRFDEEERKTADEAIERAADCAAAIVEQGIDIAMNLYNVHKNTK